jgi:zinc protease
MLFLCCAKARYIWRQPPFIECKVLDSLAHQKIAARIPATFASDVESKGIATRTNQERLLLSKAFVSKNIFRSSRLIALSAVIFAFGLGAAAQQAAGPAPPTVDEIISRYISAIGGEAVIQQMTTRASLGTIEVPAMNLSGTVLIHEKAPNKLLQVVIINGDSIRQGFDGTTAWTDDPADGTRILSGIELSETRRDADFFHPLHLHQIYSNLTLKGMEKIGDRDAYLIEGVAADESDPDKMYFDSQTGLVLRIVSHRHSSDGDGNVQEDFQDYRDVDGLKLPFTILQSGGSSDFAIHIDQINPGVSLDDAEFTVPQPNKN